MGIFNWRKKKQQEQQFEQGVQKVLAGVRASREVGKAVEEESGEDKKWEYGSKEYQIVQEEAKGTTNHFFDIFSHALGISDSISPPTVIFDPERKIYPESGSAPLFQDPETGTIGIVNPNRTKDGPALSEEVSHYIRNEMRPKEYDSAGNLKQELLTDEFFGFLGRRIVFDSLSPQEKSNFFPKGVHQENHLPLDKTKALEHIKRYKTNPLNERLKGNRDLITTHSRGYNFASRVDLSRISNWQKLFSLPDKEVRMRFFTPNPDYSGL